MYIVFMYMYIHVYMYNVYCKGLYISVVGVNINSWQKALGINTNLAPVNYCRTSYTY